MNNLFPKTTDCKDELKEYPSKLLGIPSGFVGCKGLEGCDMLLQRLDKC